MCDKENDKQSLKWSLYITTATIHGNTWYFITLKGATGRTETGYTPGLTWHLCCFIL